MGGGSQVCIIPHPYPSPPRGGWGGGLKFLLIFIVYHTLSSDGYEIPYRKGGGWVPIHQQVLITRQIVLYRWDDFLIKRNPYIFPFVKNFNVQFSFSFIVYVSFQFCLFYFSGRFPLRNRLLHREFTFGIAAIWLATSPSVI